jgi:GxxExxY protein
MMTSRRDSEMNTYPAVASDVTERIIGCAIEVHRHLGPGLLESVYESAMCLELRSARLPFERQVGVPLFYKGELIAEHRPDLVVDGQVVVEIKSVERFNPVFLAQMFTYLRVTGLHVGLILNFNRAVMKDGVRRVSLREASFQRL